MNVARILLRRRKGLVYLVQNTYMIN